MFEKKIGDNGLSKIAIQTQRQRKTNTCSKKQNKQTNTQKIESNTNF